MEYDLEHKFCSGDTVLDLDEGHMISGYASLFDVPDQSGDIVAPGAYSKALSMHAQRGTQVKLLWQHDPSQPIGVWDEIREDHRGLFVRGRLLCDLTQGREAATLIAAGAIDGLSIGYRLNKAEQLSTGGRRLTAIDLWEISLVTFPMLANARLGGKGDHIDTVRAADFVTSLARARMKLKQQRPHCARRGAVLA